MRTWEISLVDRPAILVSVDDARNLATEHTERVKAALVAQHRAWWQIWRKDDVDPYWQITTEQRIHVSLIAGVAPVTKARPQKARSRIGFTLS